MKPLVLALLLSIPGLAQVVGAPQTFGDLTITYFGVVTPVPVHSAEAVEGSIPPVVVRSTAVTLKSSDPRVTSFRVCFMMQDTEYCRTLEADSSQTASSIFLNVDITKIMRVRVVSRIDTTTGAFNGPF